MCKKMRFTALLVMLCLLVGLLPSIAFAAEEVASGTCGDNLTWALDSDGVLTISGEGEMDNYYYDAYWGWEGYIDQIKTVVIEDGVTTIGEAAFYKCASLTSVTIPDSVTDIAIFAFSDCSGLTSVTIGSGVTTIGVNAFYGCTSLTSVTIPDSVTDISAYVFSDCSSLTSVTIGSGVTTIGTETFSGCTSLTSVIIPEGVTTIGEAAFSHCDSLTSVTIPDSVTTIGGSAFCSCTNLTSVTIGSGVTTIDWRAFEVCESLTSVVIPSSVTSMGDAAFQRCTSLDTILFEGDAPAIGESVFGGYVTATAYYPAGNETWTEDVMQDYGGTITWVAYTPGETADAVVSVAAGEGVPTTDVNVPLTSEDMTLGGIGVEVSYVLNVNAVESVSEEEKALIDAALDGSTAAIYLDISLNRTVNGNTAAVTETEEMVLITMTIPTELLGENRTYSVIRVHDGEAEVLPDLDEDANTVTIQTDRFSTYVLNYSETANEPSDPEPSDPEETDPEVTDPEVTDPEVTDPEVTDPEETDPETSTPTGDNPKDGDFAPIMTCAVLMLLSAAAVVNIRKRVF